MARQFAARQRLRIEAAKARVITLAFVTCMPMEAAAFIVGLRVM